MSDSTKRLTLQDGSNRTYLPNGTKIGKYTVEFLAVGGMSMVYKTTFRDKEYVLKEVAVNNTMEVPSLMSEKSLLERLDHPGLVNYRDFFSENDYYYLVVDYVPGEPLSEWIEADRVATTDQVVDWGGQLAEIFAYLHCQHPPVIYRDLKPANVMVTDGVIQLIDFGIARVHKGDRHKDTALFGSVQTASPEHFGRSETDARSDIYTLGMTLYLLLTAGEMKKNAFVISPVKEVRPDVPQALSDAISKATELEPESRFQTMEEFREALFASLGKKAPPMVVPDPSGGLSSGSLPSGPLEPKSAAFGPAKVILLVALVALVTLGISKFTQSTASNTRIQAQSSPSASPMMAKKTPMAVEPGHEGHDHAPGEHPNPYGGKASGLADINFPIDLFSAGSVNERSVVMLGEDIGLFEVTAIGDQKADARTEVIAERLNHFYKQFCPLCGKSKLEPEDVKVGRYQETGEVVLFFAHAHDNGAVFAGPLLLATATDAQAKSLKLPPRFLASYWRDLLRDTIQVSRGLGSRNSVLGKELENALIRAREEVQPGVVDTHNLKAVLQKVSGKEAYELRETFLKVPEKSPSSDSFSKIEGYEPFKI